LSRNFDEKHAEAEGAATEQGDAHITVFFTYIIGKENFLREQLL